MTSPAPHRRDPRPALGALLARGRSAEVFDLGDGTVLKLYLDASDTGGAHREATVLSALGTTGLPLPALIAETVLDGRPGLVLERLAGPDLLSAMGTRPWTVLRAGRSLARAQVAVNELRAPGGLPSVKVGLRDRVARSTHLDDAERAQVLRMLEARADGDRLCHGDLHLENLLGRSTRPAIIDWSNAGAGPPAADVARSLVILGFGEPPVDAPVLVRRLTPALRRLVIWRYLSGYRSLRPSSVQDLDEWKVIQAAARLGETTPRESSLIRTWLARRLVLGGTPGP